MRRSGSVAEAGVPVISPRISFLLFFRRDADIWAFQMLKIPGAPLFSAGAAPGLAGAAAGRALGTPTGGLDA